MMFWRRGVWTHLLSMMSSVFSSLRTLVIFLSVGWCFFAVGGQAATLTSVQNIMTRQLISTPSNHEIRFVTPTGVNGSADTITFLFGSGFNLAGIHASDVLLTHGVTTGFEIGETLAATPSVGVWGVSVSSQSLILTPPTDAGSGEIAAGQRVIVRIGSAAGISATLITNPPTAGTYPLHIGGVFGDTGSLIIPITSSDSLSVSATVPSPPVVTPPSSDGDTGGGGATAGAGPAVTPPPPPPVTPPVPEPPPVTPPPTAVEPPGPAPSVGGDAGGVSGGGAGGGGAGSGSGGGGAATAGSGGGASALRFRDARVAATDERSLLLVWETDRATSGVVEYGVSGYDAQLSDDVVSPSHHLRVSGLQPDTLYRLRITARIGPRGEVVSTILTGQTAEDVTAPSNPLSLRAIGQDGQVALEWMNPSVEDFAEVILVVRDDRFATSLGDGRMVYTGGAQAAIDTGLLPGRTYFYTLFARDGVGNLSSGAIASAQTWGVSTDPSLLPSVTSTSALPLIPAKPANPLVRSIEPVWSEASGSFFFHLVEGGFEALPHQSIRIVLPALVDGVRVQRAEVRGGSSRYQFAQDRSGGFSVMVELPSGGTESFVIEVEFQDGSHAEVRRSFTIVPWFQVQDQDQHQAVSGTEIRVMRQTSGGWGLWDPKTSAQVNPFVTGVDGHYGFFVEPGTYQLFIRHEGFLAFDKEVVVKGNVLGVPLMIKVASPITQVLASTIEVLQSPVVQEVNKQVVAPVVVAVAVTNLATAASAVNVFRYIYFLFTQPLLLIRRKKRKQWGTVYNALSKQPIDLAIVRLVEAGTGRVAQTRITDVQGRYSFFVKPGTYRLQVVKQGYQFPTKYLVHDHEDGALLDLYHGELVEVKEGGALIAANVPVDPEDKVEKTPKRLMAERRFRIVQRVGAATGLFVSFGSLLLSPGRLTGGLFILQLLTYALFYRLAAPTKPKDWGIVYDGASKKGLGQTVVRIFDKRFHKLLETQITDKDGKYAFFAGPNVYMLMADKQGYEAYHSADIDLTQAKNPVVSEKISLQPKKT